ncbi:MAG: glycosyltransferase, partial [Clostridia bacterium]|nr:glycosyltransferase [Clostridia bacterium]
GAESQLCTFALELKNRHPEIEFEICAIKQGGVFETKIANAEIKYIILNSQNILELIIKVRRLIHKGRYDIIHSHMFLADIIARIATMGYKTKLVATHHGLGKWKTKLMLLLDSLTKFRVDQFIMVSQQSYEIRLKREKYPANKMRVIYNGLSDAFVSNTSKHLPPSDEKIIIGTTARMTDNKQINLMIDVMKRLEDHTNLFYEVIGEGENFDKLVQQVKDLHLESKVKFWGWQNDVISITKNWHLFALPSINEDLPVAMMECMAQGIVPVASSVGGIITLLDNGKNGILCDSSSMESFAIAIERLINNPEEYAQLSRNCRDVISKNYLISKTVEDTVEVYRELR